MKNPDFKLNKPLDPKQEEARKRLVESYGRKRATDAELLALADEASKTSWKHEGELRERLENMKPPQKKNEQEETNLETSL